MGMFDWYEPQPSVVCPQCGTQLKGWQGKSGPCCLFEWVQGLRAPRRQLVDDEFACSKDIRESTVLPEDFEIYTACESCKAGVEALGSCEGQVWTRLDLLDPLEPPGLPDEWMPVRGDDRVNILAELRRELPTGHVLGSRKLFPVGRRGGRDDVLLRTIGPDAQLWVVHLTWRPESDPRWPHAQAFRDFAAFIQAQEW